MGLRGLFGLINPFNRVSTLTVSTTSSERRSVERNMESTVATTLSESGLDSLLDYDEVEAGFGPIPSGPLVGERPPALC